MGPALVSDTPGLPNVSTTGVDRRGSGGSGRNSRNCDKWVTIGGLRPEDPRAHQLTEAASRGFDSRPGTQSLEMSKRKSSTGSTPNGPELIPL